MPLRSTMLIATAMTALCVNAAHAESSALASASNFRITLLDLDTSDGIAPSLQYLAPPASDAGLGFAEVQHINQRTGEEANNRQYQSAAWQPVSLTTTFTDDGVIPATTLSAMGALNGSSLETLTLSVRANADDAQGLSWAFGRAFAPLAFRLSPNTALSISFDLSAHSAHPSEDGDGAAESHINASFYNTLAGDISRDWQSFSVSHSVGPDRFDPDGGTAQTKTFTAQFSSDARDLDLAMFVHAQASALTASPVPEPHTYGMLVAGLALVGAAGRRRARRQPGA